jgi:hypothetical protein
MAKDEEHWKNPRISRYEAVLRVSSAAEYVENPFNVV